SRADPRSAVERRATRAGRHRYDPQLHANAVGQEGARVVPHARRSLRNARTPQQPVRDRRARPELLHRDPVVLRTLRPAVGAGAAGTGLRPLHVLGEHREEVPARALPRLRRLASSLLLASSISPPPPPPPPRGGGGGG